MLLWNTVDRSRQRIARSSSSLELQEVVAVEDDLAAADPGRRLEQPQQGGAERRLARPGLPIRPTNSPSEMEKLTSSTAVSARVQLGLVADGEVLTSQRLAVGAGVRVESVMLSSSRRCGLLSRSTPKLMKVSDVISIARASAGHQQPDPAALDEGAVGVGDW